MTRRRHGPRILGPGALLGTALLVAASLPARAQTAQQPSPPTATIEGLPAETRVSLPTDQLPYEVGKGPKLGAYYLVRSEDTLVSLFPPGHRPDPFDPLKDIKLDRTGSVYLIVSYDQRARYEYYSANQFDFHHPAHQTDLSFREVLGGDLHLGNHLRLYGSLASGQVGGHNYGTPPSVNRDDLTFLQLFAEVSGNVLGGTAGLRAGRQEMVLGNGTLFAARDNTNINQNYDGVRAWIDWQRFRVDGFVLDNVVNHYGLFRDATDAHQNYWGLYGSWRLPTRANLFLDPFYVGYYDRLSTLDAVTGSEAREILGGRLWGSLGALDFDWTGIWQTGSQAGHPVSAYGVFTDTGYSFANLPLKPRLGIHLDLGTGGRSTDGTIRSFEPLNFSSIYYTEAPLLAPINLMDAGAGLGANILPHVRAQAILSAFWRYSTDDAVYNFVNVAYPGTARSRSSYIGIQPALRLLWAVDRHLTVVSQLAVVDAGAALTEAGGKSEDYVSTYLLFRF